MLEPAAKSFLSRGERQSRPFPYDYFLLFILACIWGSSFMLQKVAVAEVPPVTMTAMRQIVATICMALLLLATGLSLRVRKQDHLMLFSSAVIGTALPFAFISWGLQTLDSGIAAILMGGMPLVTIVIAHYITEDEKLSWGKVIAVLLGILGLVILFWPSLKTGFGSDFVAQMVVLAAAFCYSVNSLITKKMLHLEAPVMLGYLSLWSAIFLSIGAYLVEVPNWAIPSFEVSFAIIILAIFPSVLAAFLMYELIARQGAGFFGQINLLVPLAGVIWGFLFLGERLPANAILAMLVILSGVAASRNWNKKDKAAVSASPRKG